MFVLEIPASNKNEGLFLYSWKELVTEKALHTGDDPEASSKAISCRRSSLGILQKCPCQLSISCTTLILWHPFFPANPSLASHMFQKGIRNRYSSPLETLCNKIINTEFGITVNVSNSSQRNTHTRSVSVSPKLDKNKIKYQYLKH